MYGRPRGLGRGLERVHLLESELLPFCSPLERPASVSDSICSAYCHAANSAGPFASGSTGSGAHARILESGAGQKLHDLLLRKPEPHVAHLLLIFLVMVRQHVDDEHLPPGRQTRATSVSVRAGSGE